jgi:hypothetical protein
MQVGQCGYQEAHTELLVPQAQGGPIYRYEG